MAHAYRTNVPQSNGTPGFQYLLSEACVVEWNSNMQGRFLIVFFSSSYSISGTLSFLSPFSTLVKLLMCSAADHMQPQKTHVAYETFGLVVRERVAKKVLKKKKHAESKVRQVLL